MYKTSIKQKKTGSRISRLLSVVLVLLILEIAVQQVGHGGLGGIDVKVCGRTGKGAPHIRQRR